MWFHFCVGNAEEVGRETLYEMGEWLIAGLTELKHEVTIGDKIAPNALNVIWEHFRDADEQVILDRDFKFGLIATEIPTGSTFNWREDPPWPERRRSFEKIARHAQFIWSTVEAPVEQYKEFAPTGYLELGFSERLVDPIFSKTKPVADFSFYGLNTPYRAEIIAELERHCNIQLAKRVLRKEDLNEFIASAKIGICFKQSPIWPIPSQTRVSRLLHARRGIAAEFTPRQTRLGDLTPMAGETENFVEYCLDCLRRPWKERAEEAFERFKATMPMKDIMEKLLDATVLPLSAVGASNSLSAVDDKVRVRAKFAVTNAFHLVGEEQGYNIVRRGHEFYAVNQALGPVDLAVEIETLVGGEHVLAADTEQDARGRVQAVRLRQLAEAGDWGSAAAAISSISRKFGLMHCAKVVRTALRAAKWKSIIAGMRLLNRAP